MSTTTASTLCKKTFSLESNAIVLKNEVHLKCFFEVYLIYKFRKCLLHEAILSLLDFIIAFFVMGIWNDLLEFVEWNHSNGLNVKENMNK
jgi:GT2 family glycosyltransferase